MSIHFVHSVARLRMPASKRWVLAAFADAATEETGLSFPGWKQIKEYGQLSDSQLHRIINELIAEGYLERISSGRRGQRAQYRVFARIECCPMHTPKADIESYEDWNGKLGSRPERYPNSELGSGPRDPNGELGYGSPDPNEQIGSHPEWDANPVESTRNLELGSQIGSHMHPVQTRPLISSQLSKRGEPNVTSYQSEANVNPLPENPYEELGGNASDHEHPAEQPGDPTRCLMHQGWTVPPPCHGCREAREREETRIREAQRAAALRQLELDRERVVGMMLDIRNCGMCDESGYVNGVVCHHVPDQSEINSRGAAAVRAAVRGDG